VSELDEKLNALLSDPGKMAQVMQLAQQLSGSMGDAVQPAPPPQTPPQTAGTDGMDLASMARLLPLLQEVSRTNTQASQLLFALQPFLKAEKQEKVQRAIRLAHLIHVGKRALTELGGIGDV